MTALLQHSAASRFSSRFIAPSSGISPTSKLTQFPLSAIQRGLHIVPSLDNSGIRLPLGFYQLFGSRAVTGIFPREKWRWLDRNICWCNSGKQNRVPVLHAKGKSTHCGVRQEKHQKTGRRIEGQMELEKQERLRLPCLKSQGKTEQYFGMRLTVGRSLHRSATRDFGNHQGRNSYGRRSKQELKIYLGSLAFFLSFSL